MFTALFKSGHTSTIAYYVALKKYYKSDSILNYQSLCEEIECSENSLRTHINILCKLGFITKSKSSNKVYLHLISNRKLAGKKLKWIYCHKFERRIKTLRNQYLKFNQLTINEIKKEVDSLFLTANIQSQSKAIALSHNNRGSYTGLSYKKLATLKGKKSMSTGYRIAKRSQELQLTKKINVVEKTTRMNGAELRFAKEQGAVPNYAYIKNGFVMIQKHNKYNLMQPTEIKRTSRTKHSKKHISSTTEVMNNLPFYINSPKGYFCKSTLVKNGLTKLEANKIFVAEIESTYRFKNSVTSKNIFLMSFKSLRNAGELSNIFFTAIEHKKQTTKTPLS